MRESRPSWTAAVVAASVVVAGRTPSLRAAVPPLATELSEAFVARAERVLGRLLPLTRRRPFLAAAGALEWAFLPGFIAHIAARKGVIEQEVRREIDAGARALVVIAGGYDTLAPRLAREHPALTCIEIDHPATHPIKRDVLAEHGITPPNLRLIPADLGQTPLRQALIETPETPSVLGGTFIAEGLTMYLTEEQVENLLAEVRAVGGPRSRLIFTFLEPLASGRLAFRNVGWLVRPWLRAVGEPFRWGIRRDNLAAWLGRRNFALDRVWAESEMRSETGTKDARTSLAEGECVAVARVR